MWAGFDRGPLALLCRGAQITGHLSLKEKKDREGGCGNNLSLESPSPGVEPTSWGKRGERRQVEEAGGLGQSGPQLEPPTPHI